MELFNFKNFTKCIKLLKLKFLNRILETTMSQKCHKFTGRVFH